MPPRKAPRSSRAAASAADVAPKSVIPKSAAPDRTGPPGVLCAADVRLGGVPGRLPALSGEAAEIAAGASSATWASLVDAAVAEADALILTGRLLDPAADLRAEQALREGLDRLAAADVSVLAVTDEPLPQGLNLTPLVPDESSELELPRAGIPIALLRVIAGDAAFPVPDGLPTLGVAPLVQAKTGGCDALFAESRDDAPGTLFTLPETAGAGGVRSENRGTRPVRFFAPKLDLREEPADPAAALRDAAPARGKGERLRVVDWTLRVGAWGDAALDGDAAGRLARELGGPTEVHSITVLPHPDRFADEGDEPGEPAAFLEALSHFDPLSDADPLPAALAALPADPERVRALATRFAGPLLAGR